MQNTHGTHLRYENTSWFAYTGGSLENLPGTLTHDSPLWVTDPSRLDVFYPYHGLLHIMGPINYDGTLCARKRVTGIQKLNRTI